ncbi:MULTISPECIES: LysR family transcriptional regulator [Rhodomicrobium]|uniref:LysR family transcriptional regulator n=1 Tax=Rhodomicrobium TaxID=1068 RepID=UPI000B4B0BF7|nr:MULTISPECIES: LysR family transcriptional regulator [Rhodomicrobium]
MEMRQILYFRALCEELNFTRAARRCKVSQPSLTRSILLLEQEFGGPLFHRERSNTHLSELGQIVKPHLDQVFHQAGIAAAQAREFRELKLRLKLGVMCTIAPGDLVQLFSAVRAENPGIQFDVVDGVAEDISAALQRGEREVAILSTPKEQRQPFLHYLPLYKEQFMIGVHSGHYLAAYAAVHPKDLQGVPYLYRVHCEFAELKRRTFSQQGVDHDTVYRSDRDDWILAMAAAGIGYAFLPQHCLTHPQVVARPLVNPEFWREVCLVTVRGRPHSPAVGALVHEAMRRRWAGDRSPSETVLSAS